MNKLLSSITAGLSEHAPVICMGFGIASMLAAVPLAIKATPKATQLIEEANAKKPVEMVKAAWKPYIPTAITVVIGVGCLLAAYKLGTKRTAALAAACALSDSALREYTEKAIEVFGEEGDKKVKDAVAEEKVKKVNLDTSYIINTGYGDDIMMDSITGRLFRSSINTVERAVMTVNEAINDGEAISVNEWFDINGIDPVFPIGSSFGWNSTRGKLHCTYSSTIVNDKAVVVVNYDIFPWAGFDVGALGMAM